MTTRTMALRAEGRRIDDRDDDDKDDDDDGEDDDGNKDEDEDKTDGNDDGDKKEDDCEVTRWRRALPKERSMSIPGEFLRLVTILLLVRLPNLLKLGNMTSYKGCVGR